MAVKLNQAALDRLLHSPGSPVDRHLQNIMNVTRVRAFAFGPKVTNQLVNSITEPMRQPDGSWTLTATAPYAAAVHGGAAEHVVRPTRAGALHFFWNKLGGQETLVPKGGASKTHYSGGKLIIAKGFVVIPATAPNPFMLRALELSIASS